MANTTLANLKIGALRRCGNQYNANDTALLTLAGGIINDCLGYMQSFLKATPYVWDIGNTVNTTASQAYVALVDTDILEIVQVKQTTTNTKLKQITYPEYVTMFPNTALLAGTPELVFAPTQAVNGSGVNIWTLYLGWTPNAAITMTYDYIKNIRFSSDTADSSYSPLPTVYDAWIYAEFAPRFIAIIDPENRTRLMTAEEQAAKVRGQFITDLTSQIERTNQMASYGNTPIIYNRVATTPTP